VVQEEASRVEVDGVELSASQLLERFLFPPAQQHQPVARLSGGERRRLHLCRLLISAPNVLLLDEPTNDLDVATLTVLEDFLEDFQGCVVVVSHDRWFLDRTVDRLFSFDAGRLRRFEGNYSGYLEHQLASAAAASQTPTASPPLAAAGAGPDPFPAAAEGRSAPAMPRRRSFRETRELAAIERDLPAWEERRQLLEHQMALPAGGDYGELEALSHELANLLERIASAEERWLELSDLAG
jgi:ATP-binding cassette subfamily F protein uup